jgi:hypothetical protein
MLNTWGWVGVLFLTPAVCARVETQGPVLALLLVSSSCMSFKSGKVGSGCWGGPQHSVMGELAESTEQLCSEEKRWGTGVVGVPEGLLGSQTVGLGSCGQPFLCCHHWA